MDQLADDTPQFHVSSSSAIILNIGISMNSSTIRFYFVRRLEALTPSQGTGH